MRVKKEGDSFHIMEGFAYTPYVFSSRKEALLKIRELLAEEKAEREKTPVRYLDKRNGIPRKPLTCRNAQQGNKWKHPWDDPKYLKDSLILKGDHESLLKIRNSAYVRTLTNRVLRAERKKIQKVYLEEAARAKWQEDLKSCQKVWKKGE